MTDILKNEESYSLNMLDALFASTKQKVLALFFCNPEKSFLLSEVIDKAQAGSGSVQREVQRLKASQLIILHKQDREKRYQANPDAPIFMELCNLFAKTLGSKQQLIQALQPLDKQIKLALIYGSFAKGTDHANSDIDLLLVSDNLTLEDVFKALEPAEKKLERTVNPTLYTTPEFQARKEKQHPFLTKLLNGHYEQLKGHPDDI